MDNLHPTGMRRLVGFCLAVATALGLAVVTAAPAPAAVDSASGGVSAQSAVIVANPGNRGYLDTDTIQLQLTASGGVAPYTWSASGLPAGNINISSTGLIFSTGFGPVPGFYPITVFAVDANRVVGSASFSISIGRECRKCRAGGKLA